MPIERIGTASPAAFVDTYTLLGTATKTTVASVIVVNRGNTDMIATVFVEPFESPGAIDERAYIVDNLTVSIGQTFETFRFALNVGDKIFVGASTNNASFVATGLYDQVGRTNIFYQVATPNAPQIGDIWVDSGSNDEIKVYNGSEFATIASAAPQGPTGPAGEAGTAGPTGPTGPDGSSVRVLGTYATVELLEADNTVGEIGDAYYVTGEDQLYIWSELNQEWAPGGPLGITGPQGEGLRLLGSVATVQDLPSNEDTTVSGSLVGDAYVVEADGNLYVWDGAQWNNVGQIGGPTGPTGPTGAASFSGPITVSSSSSSGVEGEILWDADYIYVCIADNTWKRVAISTW